MFNSDSTPEPPNIQFYLNTRNLKYSIPEISQNIQCPKCLAPHSSIEVNANTRNLKYLIPETSPNVQYPKRLAPHSSIAVNSNTRNYDPWSEAGQPNHHDDKVDLDDSVINE